MEDAAFFGAQKTPMKNRKVVLLATIFFAAAAIRSHAVVIVGNSQQGVGNGSIGAIAPNVNVVEAAGFTMPGQDYTLTDVRLTLVGYGGPSEGLISIYSDDSGQPGSLYALLNDDPNSTPNPQQYTFTPSGTVLLSANTSYWLVVAAESSQFSWSSAVDVPTGVATFDGFLTSSNSGSTWSQHGINFLLTINGEPPAVPDAGSTLWLMGIGFIGLGVAVRRLPVAG